MMPRAMAALAPAVRLNVLPAVFAAAVAWLGTTLADRSPPITFHGGEVIPEQAELPGRIQLVRFGTVNRRCDGQTFRWIKDPAGYVWTIGTTPTLSGQVPVAGEVQRLAGRAFDLPAMNFARGTDRGVAVFLSEIEYVCPWLWFEKNPVQRLWPIRVRLPDLRFEVIRKG